MQSSILNRCDVVTDDGDHCKGATAAREIADVVSILMRVTPKPQLKEIIEISVI